MVSEPTNYASHGNEGVNRTFRKCQELELENNRLHTECGHLQADVQELEAEIERLRADLDSIHRKQDAGVKALCEAVEGGRAATAVVTIPIWLDELRWAIVAELDSRDELIRAQKAGGSDES